MGKDKHAKIFASSETKPESEMGGKNSKDADLIRFEKEIDILNNDKFLRYIEWNILWYAPSYIYHIRTVPRNLKLHAIIVLVFKLIFIV